MIRFALETKPLDTARLREVLCNPEHGGFCAFEGWVRNSNEGRDVDGLEYEIYDELAQAEGERILSEAAVRFGGIDAHAVHRSGALKVGELAVWVGVSAAHRGEAFAACRYIIDQVKHRLPVWKKEHYLGGNTAWVACAHPGEHDLSHPGEHGHRSAGGHRHGDRAGGAKPFTPDYSRQTRLREVGEAGHARVSRSKVLVIGAGGLGSPVLSYLAGAGVGTLGIVDADRVEASNLHRQTLYTAHDVGRLKTEAAAERISGVNPALKIEVFTGRLRADDAVEVFSRFDLVVECTDDMRSRYLSSDAAVLAGIPLILASVHQYEGQLQIVDTRGGGPCLRCLWPEEPAPDAAGSCAESGVLGPVPGVLGTMQANEALKLLLGLPRPPDASLLIFDLLENTTHRLAMDPAQRCIARGASCVETARRGLTAAREEAMADVRFVSLDEAVRAGFHLVDVRNAEEIAAQPLPAPSQWLPAPDLPARGGDLPAGARVLLVCASGRRSGRTARQLRAQGMENVFSLAGGIRDIAENIASIRR